MRYIILYLLLIMCTLSIADDVMKYIPWDDANQIWKDINKGIQIPIQEYYDLLNAQNYTKETKLAIIPEQGIYKSHLQDHILFITFQTKLHVLSDNQSFSFSCGNLAVKNIMLDEKEAIANNENGLYTLTFNKKGVYNLKIDCFFILTKKGERLIGDLKLFDFTQSIFYLELDQSLECISNIACKKDVSSNEICFYTEINSKLSLNIGKSIPSNSIVSFYSSSVLASHIIYNNSIRSKFSVSMDFNTPEQEWIFDSNVQIINIQGVKNSTIENRSNSTVIHVKDASSFSIETELPIIQDNVFIPCLKSSNPNLFIDSIVNIKRKDDVECHIVDYTNLQRVIVMDNKKGDSFIPCYSFHSLNSNYTLQLNVTPTPLSITSNVVSSLRCQKQSWNYDSLLIFTIEQGKTKELSIQLPKNYHIKSYDITLPWKDKTLKKQITTSLIQKETEQNFTILFPRRLMKNDSVQVRLSIYCIPEKWKEEWTSLSLELPWIRPISDKINSYSIGVSVEADIQASWASWKNAKTMDVSTFSEIAPIVIQSYESFQLGLSTKDANATATILFTKKRASLSVTTTNYIMIEAEKIHSASVFQYDIENSFQDTFSFSLPKTFAYHLNVSTSDPNMSNVLYNDEDKIWTVKFLRPVLGKISIYADYEVPLSEGRFLYSGFSFPNTKNVYNYIGISAVSNAEITTIANNNLQSLNNEKMLQLQHPAIKKSISKFYQTFFNTNKPVEITLNIRKNALLPIVHGIVENMTVNVLYNVEQNKRISCDYKIKCDNLPALIMTLPKDAVLWSIVVNNQGVRPIRQKEKISIPLPEASTCNVSVIYEYTSNKCKTWNQEVLECPEINIPILEKKWNVWMPSNFVTEESFIVTPWYEKGINYIKNILRDNIIPYQTSGLKLSKHTLGVELEEDVAHNYLGSNYYKQGYTHDYKQKSQQNYKQDYNSNNYFSKKSSPMTEGISKNINVTGMPVPKPMPKPLAPMPAPMPQMEKPGTLKDIDMVDKIVEEPVEEVPEVVEEAPEPEPEEVESEAEAEEDDEDTTTETEEIEENEDTNAEEEVEEIEEAVEEKADDFDEDAEDDESFEDDIEGKETEEDDESIEEEDTEIEKEITQDIAKPQQQVVIGNKKMFQQTKLDSIGVNSVRVKGLQSLNFNIMNQKSALHCYERVVSPNISTLSLFYCSNWIFNLINMSILFISALLGLIIMLQKKLNRFFIYVFLLYLLAYIPSLFPYLMIYANYSCLGLFIAMIFYIIYKIWYKIGCFVHLLNKPLVLLFVIFLSSAYAEEVYLPYKVGEEASTVFMTYEHYKELWNNAHPEKPIDKETSEKALIYHAEYKSKIEKDAMFVTALFSIHIPNDNQSIFLNLINCAVQNARILNQNNATLAIETHPQGYTALFPKAGDYLAEVTFLVNIQGDSIQGNCSVFLPQSTTSLMIIHTESNINLSYKGMHIYKEVKENGIDYYIIPQDTVVKLEWNEISIIEKSNLHAHCDSVLSLEDHSLRLKSTLQYESNNSIENVTIVVPKEYAVLNIQGKNVKSWFVMEHEKKYYVPVEFKSAQNKGEIVLTARKVFSIPCDEIFPSAEILGSQMQGTALLQWNTAYNVSYGSLKNSWRLGNTFSYSTPWEMKFHVDYEAQQETAKSILNLRVNDETIDAQYEVAVTVQKKDLSELTIYLPKDYEINSVKSNIVKKWTILPQNKNNSQVMLLQFKKNLRKFETANIKINLVQDRKQNNCIDIPAISSPIYKQSGKIFLSSLDYIILNPKNLKNMSISDSENYTSLKNYQLRYAYDWNNSEYSGQVEIEQQNSEIEATIFSSVVIENEFIQYLYYLHYNIERAPCSQLTFTIDAQENEKLTIRDSESNIREIQWKILESKQHQYTVFFHNPVKNHYKLNIFSNKYTNSGNDIVMPNIKHQNININKAEYYILLQNNSQYEISPKYTNLQTIALKDVPLYYGQNYQQAYSAMDDQWSFSIAQNVHHYIYNTKAKINDMNILAIMNEQGECRTEICYSLYESDLSFLEITNLEHVNIWSAFVSETSVIPIKKQTLADDTIIVIPLSNGTQKEKTVRIIYSYEMDINKPLNLILPLLTQIQEIQNIHLTVALPSNKSYTFDSNFNPVSLAKTFYPSVNSSASLVKGGVSLAEKPFSFSLVIPKNYQTYKFYKKQSNMNFSIKIHHKISLIATIIHSCILCFILFLVTRRKKA